MAKTISIKIDTSDEAMVGGDGWQNMDAAESTSQYIENVIEAVRAEYPGYKISVEETDYRNSVEIDGDDDVDDAEHITNLISQVYQTQDWYVEKDLITYALTIEADHIAVAPKIEAVEIRADLIDGEWNVSNGYETEEYATLTDAVAAIKRMIDYHASEDDQNFEIAEVWLTVNPLADVMTPGEAVEVYALAEATVRQAINRGQIYARKSGGTWLILRADAEARWRK